MKSLLLTIILGITVYAVPMNERIAILEHEIKNLKQTIAEQEAYISADMRHKQEYKARHLAYLASAKESESDKRRNYIMDAIMLALIGGGPVLKRIKGQ